MEMIRTYKSANNKSEAKLKILSKHKRQSCEKNKKGVAFNNLGKKSCEIKGGGQEMATMMLMLIMHRAINFYPFVNAM